MAAVLVMVEPQRLVARISLRGGMGLVAADPGKTPVVELHLDAAVALAEDARGLMPLRRHGRNPTMTLIIIMCEGRHLAPHGIPGRIRQIALGVRQ